MPWQLNERNPEMNVYVLYRDMRTYGEREYLYKEARQKGVIFIRYSLENKPQVESKGRRTDGHVTDHVLGPPVDIETDLLCLATAILPNQRRKAGAIFQGAAQRGRIFRRAPRQAGARRSSPPTVCFCAAWPTTPNPSTNPLVQGQAAASRAVTLLAREKIYTSGQVAEIRPGQLQPVRGVRVGLPLFGPRLPLVRRAFLPRPGRDQSGAVQRLRPVCGLVPLAAPFVSKGLTTTRFLPRSFL